LTAIVLAVGLGFVLRPLLLPGGDPLVVPGRATPAAAEASKRVYTVQPGDTLWSIARQLHPHDDPRSVVDQLAAQVHGGSLQAGQRLVLP
jgi:LysM repeat protein